MSNHHTDAASAGLKLSRRATLKLMLALGLAPASQRLAAAADKPQALIKREIPSSGEALPVVGLGTSGAFETYGDEAALAPLRSVLRRFVSLGGALIDTSPTYGNAEQVIGRLASELNLLDDLFMATKVHERGQQEGLEQMERAERLLNTRPLDLVQVHNLIDVQTQLDTLRQWKEQGRVRYIGITHYLTRAFDELAQLMQDNDDLDFVQLNYSPVTPRAEERLLPLAADKGMAVLVNRPFEDGRWFATTGDKALPEWTSEFDCASWAQFALKYCLGDAAVTCVIPATSDPQHLTDNMQAGFGRLPDSEQRRRMREYVADL